MSKKIIVKQLHTTKEMEEFVKFPFTLYKNSTTWVPPLIKDEVASFDKAKNPVFEHASADFYLAYDENGTAIGRIAIIVNHYEIEKQGIRKVRFGWLDMIDDIAVTKALLEKVTEKAKELHLEYMEGPIGFSNLDKVGVQTEGFEHRGCMITWSNYPYYATHLEQLGLEIEKRYIETKFLLENVDYDFYKRAGDKIEKSYKLRVAPISTNKDIYPYVDEMFELFNKTYAPLSSFIPVSKKQINYFKEKFIPFVKPDFIKFILDKNGKIICFAIVLPSFSEALQKAKGKLFPFGFLHLLWAMKRPKEVDFYLIGVDPTYQSKGVPAILFREYYPIFKKIGVKICNITPELEENIAIQRIWKNFSPKIYAKRVTYKKSIQ